MCLLKKLQKRRVIGLVWDLLTPGYGLSTGAELFVLEREDCNRLLQILNNTC